MCPGKAARLAAHDAREPRRVDDLPGGEIHTEAKVSVPTFQYRQGDLFDPLIGLSVIGPFDRQHSTTAFVGPNRTVRCTCHGEPRGLLSDNDADLISRFICEFGPLMEPIALRYPLGSAAGTRSST
jgi:hypothetical protein